MPIYVLAVLSFTPCGDGWSLDRLRRIARGRSVPAAEHPAAVYGWALLRFTPEGELDRRVELPIHKPSMPCFAGSRLDTLVLTTISSGGAIASEPGRDGFRPGDLLAFDPGVRGVAEPEFAFDG